MNKKNIASTEAGLSMELLLPLDLRRKRLGTFGDKYSQ